MERVSPIEAARIAKVHIKTLYRWILRGKVRAWRNAKEQFEVCVVSLRARLELRPVRPLPVPSSRRDARAADRRAGRKLAALGF